MSIHNPALGNDPAMTEEEEFILTAILRFCPADLRDLADRLDLERAEDLRPGPMSAFMRKRADQLEAAGVGGAK